MTFRLPESREPVTGHDEQSIEINERVLDQIPRRRRQGESLPLNIGIGQTPEGVEGIDWLWHMAEVVDNSLAASESGLVVNRELTSAASLTQMREGADGLRIAPKAFLRIVIDEAQQPSPR